MKNHDNNVYPMDMELITPKSKTKHRIDLDTSGHPSSENNPTFPSARYFQIHFEFMGEKFQQIQETLIALQAQITKIEENASHDSLANSHSSRNETSAREICTSQDA